MTAISKSFVVIADGAVDPDSPIDNALVQGLRDNDVHLREWIGASYTAGAVQNHSHDGVDSALVPIGANALRNGSFESGLTGWTTATFTGGTVAINTANAMDGGNCLAFTSTVLANGGGTATSQEYIPCAAGLSYSVVALVKASVANVSHDLGVIWYDNAQTQISVTAVENSVNTPTVQTEVGANLTAPANARFMRVILYGCTPGVGSATGTIYFDQVYIKKPIGSRILHTIITATNAAWAPNPATKFLICECVGGGGAGASSTVAADWKAGGGAGGRVWGFASTIAASYNAVVGAGGTGVSAANGNPGGATSFGALATAAGGLAGRTRFSATAVTLNGDGESCVGLGGLGVLNGAANSAAANTGAGGGATSKQTVTDYAGGNGGSGVIFVWEFI